MHYTIFIPHVSNLTAAHARYEELNLKRLCEVAGDDSEAPTVAMAQGIRPDENSTGGCYFGWTGHSHEIDSKFVVNETMRWRACPPEPKSGIEKGDYWIGYNATNKPKPSELLRWKGVHGSLPYRGTKLTLRDGNEWEIPSAYYLPHRNALNWDTGKVERRPNDYFLEYCKRAGVYARQFFENEEEIRLLALMENKSVEEVQKPCEITFEDAYMHAVSALEINYRVNAAIVDILDLLSDETIVAICSASFDLQLIVESVAKKKLPTPIGIKGGSTLTSQDVDVSKIQQ